MTAQQAKPRAVIYARVSSKKQEECRTIQTQLDFITHDPVVGVRFDLLPPDRWYLDDGVSGSKKPLWERKAGKRLLAEAKSKERDFDVVLAYKFNRLGRKMVDTEQAITELLGDGLTIYDCKNQMNIDNRTATGVMVRQMMGIMAEFEVRNDAEAMRDGQERKARAGKLMPSYLRLGYDWSAVDERGKKAKGATMVVNPEEAKLVQLIFEMYQQWGQSRIAWWLNENGYRMPCKAPGQREKHGRSERLFCQEDITQIVSSPIYTGMVHWGRTTQVAGLTPTPYSYHVPELQIISFEDFNRVQRLMEQRRTVPSKSAGSPFAYSGLLRCPKCGGRTAGIRQWNSPYGAGVETRRYLCRAYHKSGKVACAGWVAYEQSITRAVIPFLVDLFENRMGLKQAVEEEARYKAAEEHQTKLSRLQGQLEAAQSQLKNVQSLTVQGLMTAEEAKPFIFEARETLERCKAQLVALEQRAELHKDLAADVAAVCADLQGALEGLPPVKLQSLVRQVFKSFSIGKRGTGRSQRTWVETYEFTDSMKDLLAASTLTVDTRASPGSCARRALA
jgi:site-specific DNA recombinase